ncbi:FHA domain-containing protein [Dyadobacter psychrotolerans]|uniref:FHA domain-containing protein n=1 Tax=Dyadobacter psychrotolerans TaxID=2541721 RepID=A0A4R5D4H3_9BACT|nr:FHA domain-containing protein [Dyadobacter psychrotolerans]TDE08302.1 FHA domain-containing protein [Dyadobacter psychrotolerans]
MDKVKNEIIACSKCRNGSLVIAKDFAAGFFLCKKCGHVNTVSTQVYDEEVLEKLPHTGFLVSVNNPSEIYALRPGVNVIGVGEMADVVLKRVTHDGKCFISRQHCTITVSFGKWNGQLSYLLEDGAADPTGGRKASLNHTFYKGKKVEQQDALYVGNQDLINLGGEDAYRLEHYIIPAGTLENYKISQRVEDGGTD